MARSSTRHAKGALSYFTRHGTLANLVLAVMVVAGLAAASRIRAQFFPDVIISEISITTTWDGAGAEDVDRAIVQLLEPVLLTVDGVTDVTSLSSEGSARITLEFEPGMDLQKAADDTQTAIDTVNTLPADADDPVVRRGAWRDRVTDVVLTGPVAVDQLGRFADELVTRLFDRGITRTTIRGLADPEIMVEVTSASLIVHDITMAEIATAIAAEVQSAPAGDVGGGASRVRTGQEARTADHIRAIVLRQEPDGTSLTIGDLADVRDSAADRGRATFVGPNPAMTLRVDRNDTGDAIRMQAEVQAVIDQMTPLLPPETKVELVRERAEYIASRLELLLDNAALGLALVVGLLFLFLNARTALWVAAGIPVSLLAAVALMYGFGLTLNMISLFALIITLGIIVDDAIVVGEHADFRARHLGEPATEAAENAAARMSMPVVASTLTTVIAFAGLMVISGRFGSLVADIPVTVIAVLMASLVECFVILPNHMAHALRAAKEEAWYDWPSRQMNKGLQWLIRVAVRPLVALVIRARMAAIALALLLLATQAALFISGDLKFRFFNSPEQSSISGNFAMLPGATREDTLAMMRELQRATDAVTARYTAEYGTNPASFVMAEVGGGAGRGLSSADTKDADLLGGISIEIIDPDDRPYATSSFLADLQDEVRPHPLLEELSFRGARFGPGGDALSVDISGASSEVLKAAAEALKTAMAPFPEVSALEDSLAYDKEELVLSLTPQGQALGFEAAGLGRVLRDRLNGIEAATFPDGTRSAAIRVELPADELTADFLESTLLRASPGVYVPLGDIVTVERRSGFSTIRRENGLRIVTVSGDIAEDDPARAAEVQRALTEDILPKLEQEFGVTTRQSGLAEQQSAFLGDAVLGLMLCLLGIYMVLAWVFASWTRPVVVMVVIPFGLIGAVYGHHFWGVPLSMFSIVGMIGMTGIIINDSIVLVSTIDEYSEKRGLYPAIVDAVSDRLRPVFLTTATTVMGLAPLLYERSSQAEFLRPTVITLVYGLGFGMVLVLLLVPAVLAVQADFGRQLGALRRGLRARAAPHLRLLLWGALVAVAAWFALTLGGVLVTGAPLVPLGVEGTSAVLGLFLGGTVALLLATYALGFWLLGKRQAGRP
ncbi:efflux RND transporter permease subunit [Pseudorhodobacter aquimaris]|uniref:efflux RND transporter permease subunit n=1 Tax=Pseudorhodobacter aquimaris TaxID=687412 RepID=UPI00067D83D6|nr:efflux RND transporter permease subunit [Pseudorhodobacter aquimaris]